MPSPFPERLSVALSDNERTRPIVAAGGVVQGAKLDIQTLHPSEMFWRQLHHAEFDISEMSLASLIITATHGDDQWAAIPVFTMRKFFHTGILVRTDAGIDAPADLRGKRVGVPEYQQSSAIWSRGIMSDHFGVTADQMTWFMERGPDRSHGNATGFTPPPGVVLHQIPPEQNIGEMMLSGDLDATLLYLNDRNAVDRSRADLDATPLVRPLFTDIAAEEQRFYAGAGYVPVNHVLVVRRSLIDARPELATELFAMFDAVRADVAARGADPWPILYGFEANREPLQTLSRYLHEQGLIDAPFPVERLFAPSTLSL